VRLQSGDRIELPSAAFTFRRATMPEPEIAPVAVEPSSSPATVAKPERAELLPQAIPVAVKTAVPSGAQPPADVRAPAPDRKRSGKKWLIGVAVGLALAGVGSYIGLVAPAGKVSRVEIPPPTAPSLAPVPGPSWTNSLGMGFVPAGTPNVLFGIWEVRVKDFQAYVEATQASAVGGIFVTKAKTKADGSPALAFERDPEASWKNPGFDLEQGSTDPVVGVSWNDAEAFCQWLTKKEHAEGKLAASRMYRLPTDAEWSRAVGSKKYPWGDTWPPPDGAGNYGDQALAASLPGAGWDRLLLPENDGYSRTSPVGSFRANAYGLYDMGGNVWQWCEDWYEATMNNEEVLQTLPSLRNDGGGRAYKVLRGASWDDYWQVYLLSSCRSCDYPEVGYADRGFRVVVADAP